MFLVIKLEELH